MEKNSELVSILIPTYNRKKLVIRAIESALIQSYTNIEIIVSDNCSSDGTFEYLRKIYQNENRVKIFKNDSNIGPVNNWLSCINKSSGIYSKILFSDDAIKPNYIEETVKILKNCHDVGFVYTPTIIEVNNKKRLFYKTYNSSCKLKSNKLINRFLIDLNVPVSPGAALFRREDLINNIKLSFPNKKQKDFTVYGAGIDLNIYFECLKKYEFVYFSNETKAIFFGNDSSFTISNNLDYYYQIARLNVLKSQPGFLKKIIITFIIKTKITKILNYFSPYFNVE